MHEELVEDAIELVDRGGPLVGALDLHDEAILPGHAVALDHLGMRWASCAILGSWSGSGRTRTNASTG